MMKHLLLVLPAFFTFHSSIAQSAGNLDPTFGNGGKIVTSLSSGQDRAQGVLIQSDGKILVAGYTSSTVTGRDFLVLRYHTDGTPDSTFGVNGVVLTDLQSGSDDAAYSLALQSDGKIVLGGYSDNGSDKNAALVRYLSNGTVDSTFGTNGVVLTDFENNQQDEIRVVRIHALSGKIIAGGSSTISSNVSKPVIARYNSDGVIDSSFNNTGIRLLWITSLDYQYLYSVEDLAVQSNGKISAVGWRDFPSMSWSSDYWACRINSDGTMDNTFSTDGVNVYNGGFNGNDRAYSMMLNSNNNIVASGGGYLSTLRYEFTFFDLTAAGASGGTSASADFGSMLDDMAYGMAADNNNHIVLGGSSGTISNKSFAIARFSTAGTIDNAFGSAGKVTTTFGGNALNECFDIAVQQDDKIVAVGYTGNDIAIARYLGTDVPQLNAFQLVSPTDAAVNQNYATLAFDWTDAFGATSYSLELATDQNFTTPQSYSSVTSSKTVTGLQPQTVYYWRVKASDGVNWGDYSVVRSFTTNSLENFNLVSPANNSTNQLYATLSLDWSDALGSSSYEVQVDTVSTFDGNPQTFTSSTSAYTVNNLLPVTTYYWRVRAYGSSVWGQWTTAWNFTTKAVSSAAIDELPLQSVRIYPNPTTNFCYVVTNGSGIGLHYTLTDLTGRVIQQGSLTSESTLLQVKGISAGTYVLHVENHPSQRLQIGVE